MSSVEEKLAKSLTAGSVELIPFLPYLLQDLWEMGSSPKDMLSMVKKHLCVSAQTKVLDLACGKGSVSIYLAKQLGCRVKGIDIVSDFIAFARQKAVEYGVEDLCDFTVGDIIQLAHTEKGYDIVILGAVGDVLGTPEETVRKLKSTLRPGGYILIDDAYATQDTDTCYYTREKWMEIFDKTGVILIEEQIADLTELEDLNQSQQESIAKRAKELMVKHPEKSRLFEGYIISQQDECRELENEISGVTLLLQAVN